MSKKYTECAHCGEPLGDEYVTVQDNFLQAMFFEEEDGSDNAFCSKECACNYLAINTVSNEREG